MKKQFLICLTIFSLILSQSLVVHGATNEQSLNLAPDATSAILIERDTGEILYHKNEHEQLPPASMTKIMTLLLVMEALEQGDLSLDEKVRVSEKASGMGGSQVFLETNEEMSVEDLIKAVAIASGNDASVALAERIAGSEEAFVQRMNEKAKQLNLKNTHFVNSSGLPAENYYSSAYDMSMISKELLSYESITDYTSLYDDYLIKGEKNEFWLVNTNKLVRFYPGVDGLKTGYTEEAKYCLAATAMRDNMRVVAVVMGADTVKKRNAQISQMLDYAFNHYSAKKVVQKGETMTTLDFLKANQENIPLVTKDSVSILLKKGDVEKEYSQSITYESTFPLPVKVGDELGTLTIKDDEKIIAEVPLTVNEQIDMATYGTLFKRTLQKLTNIK